MMMLMLLFACQEGEVARTVTGLPIDEHVATCRPESEFAIFSSHTAAAHVINVAVCEGMTCTLTPEPDTVLQSGAQILLDCAAYEEGATLRVRTLRLE